MAGNPGTGGKIRPRRAVIARTPYSRAPSQRKSLFGRVTDSFKSILSPITPRWLSNRMGTEAESSSMQLVDNQDAADSGFANSEEPSSSANHQESCNLSNSDYKRSPLRRPVSRTSNTSLQYYETPPDTPPRQATPSADASTGGKGKEGLLKHLALSSKRARMEIDSPVPSNTSFLRDEMNTLSTNDNGFVPSTSRWSSSAQVGSRRNLPDRESNQKSLWSFSADLPFSTASTSRQQATMNSHKRPRFNPTLFGTQSFNTSKSSEAFQSSFYQGPVQFGGASASGRSLHFGTPYKIPTVTKVKVRHVNHHRTLGHSSAAPRSSRSAVDGYSSASTSGMSSTAKRILQTLEKMSSPMNDKVQATSSSSKTPSSYAMDRMKRRATSRRSTLGGTLLQHSSSAAARRSRTPLTDSLVIRDRDRAKFGNDGNVRLSEISASTKSNVPDSKAVSDRGPTTPVREPVATPKFKTQSRYRSDESHGRMMRSQRQANSQLEGVSEPNLPDATLPISKMPSFRFERNRMTSTPASKEQEEKTQPEFSFTSPVVKTTKTKQLQVSTNTPDFQFSSPPVKGSAAGNKLDASQARLLSKFATGSKPGHSVSSLHFAPDPKVMFAAEASKRRSSPLVNSGTEAGSRGPRVVESLKSGSVLDILGGKDKDMTSGATSTPSPIQSLPQPLKQVKKGWTCDVCMVLNEDCADCCVACTSPKPGASMKKPSLSSTLDQKKGWDCSTCMVPNDPGVERCVACEEPRPGSVTTAAAACKDAAFKPTNFGSPKESFSFGIPQKKDAIANSFGLQFKKAEGTWECGTCLVSNDSTSEKCVSCQTAKAGSATGNFSSSNSTFPVADAPQFKFGLSSLAGPSDLTQKPATAWGDIAKKPASSWVCEACMVPNSNSRRTCEACDTPKPGTEKELSSTLEIGKNAPGLFKFGIPDAATSKDRKQNDESVVPSSVAGTFSAGEISATADTFAASKPTFSFGVPLTKTTAPSTGSAATPSFSFGQRPAEAGERQEKDDIAPAKAYGLFAFGAREKDEQPAGGSIIAKSSASTLLFGGSSEKAKSPSQDFGFSLGAAANREKGPESQIAGGTSSIFTGFGGSKMPATQPPGSVFGGNFASSSAAPSGARVASTPPLKTACGTVPAAFGGFSATTASTDGRNAAGGESDTGSSPSVGIFAGNGSAPKQIFGSASSDASSLKPSFNFGGGQDKLPAFQFGSDKSQPTNAPSQSGADTGGGSKSAEDKQSGFQFGSSKSPLTNDAPFQFGAHSSTSSKPTLDKPSSGLQFGTSSSGPINTSFQFGARNEQSLGNTPGFQFSSSNSETTKVASAPFQFGAASGGQGGSSDKSAGFQFGVNNTGSTTAPFQFGAGTLQNSSAALPSTEFKQGSQVAKPDFSPAPSSGTFQFGRNSASTVVQSNGLFPFGASESNDDRSKEQAAATDNKPFAFGVGGGASAAPSFNFIGGQNTALQFGSDAPGFSAPNQNPFGQGGQSASSVQGRRKLQAKRRPRK